MQPLSDGSAVRVTDILEMGSLPTPQGLSLKPPLSADPSSCWHTGGFGQENGLLGLLPASFVPTSLPSNSGRKTLQPAFLLAHSGGHADFRKHLRHEVCNEELLTAPS